MWCLFSIELNNQEWVFIFSSCMLYKNYRYIIIIKVCLLVWWVYLLFSEWNKNQQELWTLIIAPHIWQEQNIISLLENQQNNMQLPWSLLIEQDDKTIALHIPQTNDTWYIISYLQNPKPLIENTNKVLIEQYVTSCHQKIIIRNNAAVLESCNQNAKNTFWITMGMILLGLLL